MTRVLRTVGQAVHLIVTVIAIAVCAPALVAIGLGRLAAWGWRRLVAEP